MKTLYELTERFFQYGESPAIITGDRTVTYKNLIEGCAEIERALGPHLDKSVDRRVVILVKHELDLIRAFYAVARTGCSGMLLRHDIPNSTLLDLAVSCGAYGFLVDEQIWQEHGREISRLDLPVFLIGRNGTCSELSQSPKKVNKPRSTNEEVCATDEAAVLFTSGTTGDPKGVPVSHQNFIEVSNEINLFLDATPPICEYVSVPIVHSFGLRRVICSHLLGGVVVLNSGSIDASEVLELMNRAECNAISCVPTFYRMLKAQAPKKLGIVARRINFIELGSAAMSAAEKVEISKTFPNANIMMHYGLTEATKLTMSLLSRGQSKLETVGRPSKGTHLSIRDGNGKRVKDGQVGEIWAAGEKVCSGYINVQKTTEPFLVDGWFRTGDVGSLDSEGYLTVLGRVDDEINTGGRSFSPQPLEQYLSAIFPDLELVIVGRSSRYLGEVPVLCCTESAKWTFEKFLHARKMLKSRFERYKIPQDLVAVKEFPRTSNGKTNRKELKSIIDAEENS